MAMPCISRFAYKLTLPTYRCYHVSVDVKTDHYTAHPQIQALLRPGRGLTFSNLKVEQTQNWTHQDVIFNTLDQTQVMLYFGVWDECGTPYFANWKIEEYGRLRAPPAAVPCTVKMRMAGTASREPMTTGSSIPTWEIPWPGEYQVWMSRRRSHDLPMGPPARLLVLPGDHLRRPAVLHLRAQDDGIARRPGQRMKELWQADGYMMSHDEFRVFGCQKLDRTPGRVARRQRRACPASTQNGVRLERHVRSVPQRRQRPLLPRQLRVPGPAHGKGLDKSIVIVNWN